MNIPVARPASKVRQRLRTMKKKKVGERDSDCAVSRWAGPEGLLGGSDVCAGTYVRQ